MNFKTKKLAIATAAAFAMGAAGQAQSTDLLFPYVVVSDTVTTIVNVINTNTPEWYADQGAISPPTLHYRLWYKSQADAVDNLSSCVEVNVNRRTSGNDIQTIDLGDRLDNVLGVMFDDPSINNDWQAAGASYALARNASTGTPVRAYLAVDDQTQVNTQHWGDSGIVALRGEATVFEFQAGAQWGYQAGAGLSSNGSPADFRDPDLGIAFGPLTGPSGVNTLPVSILPWGVAGDLSKKVAQTRFFVTPLIDDMRGGNNSLGGNAVRTRIAFEDTERSIVGFDRDENPTSGSAFREVRCVGAVDAEHLLTQAARTDMGPDGGWAFLTTQGRLVNNLGQNSAANDSVSASVIKLEFNDGTTSFAGVTEGVFNNAFQLRNADAVEN